MAKAYRQHLIDEGILTEKSVDEKNIPIRIDFLMSDSKKGVFSTQEVEVTSTVLTNKQCVFRRSTGDETVYVAINADDQEYTAYFGAEKNQVTDLLSGAIMNLDGGLKMA